MPERRQFDPCRLTELGRELFLVIEHLTLDDVPRARDFVLGQIDKL